MEDIPVFSSFLTLTVALLIYIICRWLHRPIEILESWKIPYIKPWPLIGNYHPNLGLQEQLNVQRFRQHQAYGMLLFRLPFMVLTDPWTVQQVTIKQFQYFTNRGVSAINPYPMNKSLFSLADDHWRHVRSTVSPAFSSGRIRAMYPSLASAAQTSIAFLQSRQDPNSPVDARQFFKFYVINAIASSLFGMDINAYQDKDHPFFIHALGAFNTNLTNPILFLTLLFPEYMHIFSKFGSAMLKKEALYYFRTTVDYILDQRKRSEKEYHDFLGVVANSEVKETEKKTRNFLGQVSEWSRKGLTKDEIFGQAIAFMAAGFEAGATTMKMLAYCLAKNPEKQDKLYSHIMAKIGTKEPEYEDLNNVPYLDWCIHESLRLYPSNHSTERICGQTIQIGNLTIPEGTMVLIPFLALGTDPQIWEHADQFIPERFEEKPNPYRSVPFGVGPRECIGRRLAWIEMKILAVKLLQRYSIQVMETRPMRISYMGFLNVDPPIQMRFVPRSIQSESAASC